MVVLPLPSLPECLNLDLSCGLTLFWAVPCDEESGIMSLVDPSSEIGPHSCFSSRHRLGRNEELWTVKDDSLEQFAVEVLPKFAATGWRGH
jgi:hypothetical protein